MGFIHNDIHVRYPHSLHQPGKAHPLDMPYTEGVVGLSLERGQVFCWPTDPATHNRRINNDPLAKREIFGPLRFQDRVTGTIWLSSYVEDVEFQEQDREKLRVCISRVEDLLFRTAHDWVVGVEPKLFELVKRCCIATQSDRGYLAIEKPNQDLEYFRFGKDKDKFLLLNRFEGLCGVAFQHCKTVNCPDVLKDENYLPSHAQVRSELVVPIVEETDGRRRRSIALINMESYEPHHYREDVEEDFVRKLADKDAHLVRLYRSREEERARLHGDFDESTVNTLVNFAQQALTTTQPIRSRRRRRCRLRKGAAQVC